MAKRNQDGPLAVPLPSPLSSAACVSVSHLSCSLLCRQGTTLWVTGVFSIIITVGGFGIRIRVGVGASPGPGLGLGLGLGPHFSWVHSGTRSPVRQQAHIPQTACPFQAPTCPYPRNPPSGYLQPSPHHRRMAHTLLAVHHMSHLASLFFSAFVAYSSLTRLCTAHTEPSITELCTAHSESHSNAPLSAICSCANS